MRPVGCRHNRQATQGSPYFVSACRGSADAVLCAGAEEYSAPTSSGTKLVTDSRRQVLRYDVFAPNETDYPRDNIKCN